MTNNTLSDPHITGIISDPATGKISFESCIEGNRTGVMQTTTAIMRQLKLPFNLFGIGNTIMLTLTEPTSDGMALATNEIKRVYSL